MTGLAIAAGRTDAPDESVVRRMLAAAPHRGDQVSVTVCGRVRIGITRDSSAPNASLHHAEGLLGAVSGSFDNLEEPELADLAPAATDRCSAAVLLAAYRRWGRDCVSRLRGKFAGVVTDGRWLLVFRDQFGGRPLFHRAAGTAWFAATEIKQVAAGVGLRREPDWDHLERVLFGGVDLSTAVRGIERIPRGTSAVVSDARVGPFHRYWQPHEILERAKGISAQDARDGVAAALDRATARCLRGRDAILLSGGLDSPAIAASAIRAPSRDELTGVTAVFPRHGSVDERPWTELVAAHLGLPLRPYEATATAMDDTERWIDRVDGPVDVLSLPECSEAYEAVRAAGGRTALNGEVAEYLFHSRGALLGHLLYRGRGAALRQQLGLLHARGRSRRRLVRDIVRDAAPMTAMRWYYRHDSARVMALPPWVDKERASARWFRAEVRPWNRWAALQTSALTGSGLQLEADDIVAAHSGVDSRRPFTDVDLWEFVLSLPAEAKLFDLRPKPLLRAAMRGRLPDQHLDRRDKTYFDQFQLDTTNYPKLKSLLADSDHRIPGVDYPLLQKRLEQADFGTLELRWARDLARIHAYLESVSS